MELVGANQVKKLFDKRSFELNPHTSVVRSRGSQPSTGDVSGGSNARERFRSFLDPNHPHLQQKDFQGLINPLRPKLVLNVSLQICVYNNRFLLTQSSVKSKYPLESRNCFVEKAVVECSYFCSFEALRRISVQTLNIVEQLPNSKNALSLA